MECRHLVFQEQLGVPTKVRSAELRAQSPGLEPGQANPRSEEQEWHKDSEWLAKGHLLRAKDQNLQLLCCSIFIFPGFSSPWISSASNALCAFVLFSLWNLVKMCGFLSPAAKTRAVQTKQSQKPSRMHRGLCKYYLEVGLYTMVRGKNPKFSLRPKPDLQDSGAVSL